MQGGEEFTKVVFFIYSIRSGGAWDLWRKTTVEDRGIRKLHHIIVFMCLLFLSLDTIIIVLDLGRLNLWKDDENRGERLCDFCLPLCFWPRPFHHVGNNQFWRWKPDADTMWITQWWTLLLILCLSLQSFTVFVRLNFMSLKRIE